MADPRPPQKQRQDIVLGLLYAAGTEWEEVPGTPRPYTIAGKTRLRLGIALYDHFLDKEFGTRSPFSFTPQKYCPDVNGLESLLNNLEHDETIWTRRAGDTKEYQLVSVSEGKEVIQELGDKGELIKWVTSRHVQRQSGALLAFAYREADEHFEEVV